MESFKPPSPLILDGNLCENFRKFKQSFEIFMLATGFVAKESHVKVAMLLNVIGDDAVELFNTFELTDENKKDYEKVLKAFADYCDPVKNIVVERFKFHSRSQEEGESFDLFLNDLKKLIKSCEFKDQADSVVRDRIVLGIRDKGLQERLLREPDLTLPKAIEQCRVAELGKQRAELVQNKVMVTPVKRQAMVGEGSGYHKQTENPRYRPTDKAKREDELMKGAFHCKYCRRVHKRRECPAYGKTCHKCNKMNHFSVACMQNVAEVRLPQDNLEEFFVDTVESVSIEAMSQRALGVGSVKQGPREWIQTITVVDKQVPFKLDTGSEVNIIPQRIWQLVGEHGGIKGQEMTLEGFGGMKVKPLGVATLKCSAKQLSTRSNIEFVVVDNEHCKMPILGLPGCATLGLVSREHVDSVQTGGLTEDDFRTRYEDIFSGSGCVDTKCHLKVDPSAKPVAKPPRRIPISLRERLQEKLTELQSLGIIEKVDQPASWVSNLTIVEKTDGSLRLCLDPTALNGAICREFHMIPTLEDMSSKLQGKSVFTVLDLKDGFYQVPLEESSFLCTFSTPFGTFKFLRLPFGLSCAPEIFQRVNEGNFADIPGVIIYFDDLLVSAENEQQHDEMVTRVAQRARDLNVKFNVNKMQFKKKEVKYFGHLFSQQGVRPDPQQVNAVQAIQVPKNKEELQRILGFISYLRKFLPNLATIVAPLRDLLKKNTEWLWLPVHDQVLSQVKTLISTAPVLGIFDPDKAISLQCDASKSGLGCCLMCDGQPISFASRSLSPTEQNYAQVEKEMLSIVFAVKKFHHFIYGRAVTVQTDHKPLVPIFKKNLADIFSARLQRMRIRLLKYSLVVEYLPGKMMHLADLLSRSFLPECDPSDEELSREMVHLVGVADTLQVSPARKEEFRSETAKDPVLCEVMSYCKVGWPDHKRNLTTKSQLFFVQRYNLHVEKDLLFLNDRVVVPQSLQGAMLQLLHEGHLGIEKTKSRARQVLYWPKMLDDIERLVNGCALCQKLRGHCTREPLLPHEVPDLPFAKVGVDICDYGGRSYLVAVDYYSKWIEVVPVQSKQASDVIKSMKSIFATHGVPKVVVSDNMPFNSHLYKLFAKQWDFEIVTSSPRYPRSNGQAERAVQVAKNMLRKCSDQNDELPVMLLEHRNTPLSGVGLTPAQLLMSRRTRSKLPMKQELLHPQLNNDVTNSLRERQLKQKQQHDRLSKEKQAFHSKDRVLLWKGGQWTPAEIVEPASTPRSYWVRDDNDVLLRRNSIHLRRSNLHPEAHARKSSLGPDFKGFPMNVVGEHCEQSVDVQVEVPRSVDDQARGGTAHQGGEERVMETAAQLNQPRFTRSGREVLVPVKYRD